MARLLSSGCCTFRVRKITCCKQSTNYEILIWYLRMPQLQPTPTGRLMPTGRRVWLQQPPQAVFRDTCRPLQHLQHNVLYACGRYALAPAGTGFRRGLLRLMS